MQFAYFNEQRILYSISLPTFLTPVYQRKKQEKDEENAQSATDQYEPSIEQTQDLFEVNDSENTEYDLGEGEEMAEVEA